MVRITCIKGVGTWGKITKNVAFYNSKTVNNKEDGFFTCIFLNITYCSNALKKLNYTPSK